MKKEFYVQGMHCAACELLIEDKLNKVKGVENVKADIKTGTICIHSTEEIKPEKLSKIVEEHGYKISNTKVTEGKNTNSNLINGFLIATTVFGAFLLMQKLQIINLFNPEAITLPFVFFIGVVASLSTCMAVVGGLVLSISSNCSKNKNPTPLVAFHLSRLIGFFMLGGILGLLGATLSLNNTAYFIMDIVLFVVMVIMGLNLLEIFSFTNYLQLKMPKSLGQKVVATSNNNGIIAAGLTGIATFILPCGFTQSMQMYSLTTGNFLQGALTMGTFALGTLPILGLISFVSVKLKSKLFFTTAGFLVLMFAILNFVAGMSALGIIVL